MHKYWTSRLEAVAAGIAITTIVVMCLMLVVLLGTLLGRMLKTPDKVIVLDAAQWVCMDEPNRIDRCSEWRRIRR